VNGKAINATTPKMIALPISNQNVRERGKVFIGAGSARQLPAALENGSRWRTARINKMMAARYNTQPSSGRVPASCNCACHAMNKERMSNNK
jgi:hypothetical protein